VKTAVIVKDTIPDEKVEILRDNCNNLRDRALIDFLLSTGIRVGELVRLNIDDIDFSERECVVYGKGDKDEMHMVNMVSREVSVEIAQEKTEIIRRYLAGVQAESVQTIRRAVATLNFKTEESNQVTIEGLHIYINAVLNKYLVQYQQAPNEFFENSEKIKAELKAYLDVMLYGICK